MGKSEQQTGTIKIIHMSKGFGFIRTPSGQEYFFHRSSVQHMQFEEMEEGLPVVFTPRETPKGPRAENVAPDNFVGSGR